MHLSSVLFLRIQKMIPNPGCDPNINIIKIGAYLLSNLKSSPCDVTQLLKNSSDDLSVSIDHIILSLDWLYVISAIKINKNEISINDTK